MHMKMENDMGEDDNVFFEDSRSGSITLILERYVAY